MKRSMYVVDDDPDSADLFAEFGELLGFETRAFYKTRDFQQAVDSQPPDLVVVDLTIPEIDGIEIIHWLGQRQSKAGILIVSGFDDRLLEMAGRIAEHEHLNLLGALSKPLDLKAFRNLVSAQ